MTCQYCGTEIIDATATFCPKCGKPIHTPSLIKTIPCRVWPEWDLEEKPIGKGSFGTVYKASRTVRSIHSLAAIKVISIPSDSAELDTLRSEGMTDMESKLYLQGIMDDFISEIQLMESMKGIQNIVSVEDYEVVEKEDSIGWDIYIRMELLTPFGAYTANKTLSEDEVIKLGCDICTALEICSQRNIIHRDIKPENIFINDFGHFKLGDFGIARKLENMTGGLSQKGTFNYMAPEVANSGEYDARVDIYSLGIVLYRLLNGNRLPFVSVDQFLNANQRKLAVERRIRGEALPAPCNASPEMAEVILKACKFDPTKRFVSATEMKKALQTVANGTYTLAVAPELDETVSVRKAPTATVPTVAEADKTTAVRKAPSVQSSVFQADTPNDSSALVQDETTKNRKPLLIGLIALLVAVCVLTAIFVIPGIWDEPSDTDSSDQADSGSNINQDDDSIETPSTPDDIGQETSYTITIKSAGGMALENAEVCVYNTQNVQDILACGTTNTDGNVTLKLPAGGNYFITLDNLPKGYQLADSYSFTGTHADIILTSSLITDGSLADTTLGLGDVMYDFSVTTARGETVQLSEMLKDKDMVLINFWYSTSGPCDSEFSYMEKVYQQYSDKVGIIALAPLEDATTVSLYQGQKGLSFPMAPCPSTWASTFSVSSYPTSIVVDRYGMICLVETGALTSQTPFISIFEHFSGDDYVQKLCPNGVADVIVPVKPTTTMPTSKEIADAINSGNISVSYLNADGANLEYNWPFVIGYKNGSTCIKSTNAELENSYSIIRIKTELKAGEALGFDYIVSCEAECDLLYIIVDDEIVYTLSGWDEIPQWQSIYPCVATADGIYEITLFYCKDESDNAGEDTVYIKNVHIMDAEDIGSPA